MIFKNPWLVQLATRAKRRVAGKVGKCSLGLEQQKNVADLNMLSLGSYDVLIRMYWLERHWFLVNCKDKIVCFIDESDEREEIQGMKRTIKLQPITASQLGKSIRKSYQIYVIHIYYTNSKDKITSLENVAFTWGFIDVLWDKLLVFPPKWHIDFTIQLILEATPMSRTLYRMSITKLTELKM